MITINYKQGKNSSMGNPRIEVIGHDNADNMEQLIKDGFFRENKNGIVSVANSSFVYKISGVLTDMLLRTELGCIKCIFKKVN